MQLNFNNIDRTKPLIIAFNGAPFSGKDSLADHLFDITQSRVYSYPKVKSTLERVMIKDTLIELTKKHYNISDERFIELNANPEIKSTPMDELGGLTIRQCLIHVSEDIYKPSYGDNYFISKTADKMNDPDKVYIITDLGFDIETKVLSEKYGQNFVVVVIKRPGFDFSMDSRKYLDVSQLNHINLINNDLKTYLSYGVVRLLKLISIFNSHKLNTKNIEGVLPQDSEYYFSTPIRFRW